MTESFWKKLLGRRQPERRPAAAPPREVPRQPPSEPLEVRPVRVRTTQEAPSPRAVPVEPEVVTPTPVPIAPPERTIRVFVSSTFRDMQAERDVLVKRVFPQLRKLCEARAVAWTEVDLRWGITTEEASEGKVLPLCLAEIQRCRPYFIGLLGERYGWVPGEQEVPGDLLATEPWLLEHRTHSVTELEVLHGVLRNPAMADRALFYFRDPAYLERLPAGENPADFAGESPDAAARLADLKSRIRAAHAAGSLRFPPREGYPTPEALGEQVLQDFTAIIEELYPQGEVPDPLEGEAARHEAYARSRRLAFVGREDLLQELDAHVAASGARPAVLTGEPGCGKSTLLAEWVARWRQVHPADLVIQHYTGSTPESADWQGLVRRILGELKRAFAIADELPVRPDALRGALQDWLAKAGGERRIVLVLDALNQLANEDGTAHQLGWLPTAAPPNVRMVVSTLAGECLEVLRQRDWLVGTVPLFDRADIAPAATAYFSLGGKKLPRQVLARLEAAPAARNPLYLRAVLDELRQLGRHEELEASAEAYLAAPDLPMLFDRILDRWHGDFGQDGAHPDLVRRSLCLIACARLGLSEIELLDLLGTRDEAGTVEPLPRRHWTPFHLAAESALTLRSGLLGFGHEYLRAAVERRWLAGGAEVRPVRLHLADYFGGIPEPTDRKLDELPSLLRDTAQWERLRDLLADLPSFHRLRGNERWKWELQSLWLALGPEFDPVETYDGVLAQAEPGLSEERLASLLNAVASFHLDAGRFAAAEPLFRRALDVRERTLGPEHPDTLSSLNNLAYVLDSIADYAGAEPLYRRALEAEERLRGPDHPSTLCVLNNLAFLLANQGKNSGAEALYRRALAASEGVLGPDAPGTLFTVNNLASLLLAKEDLDGAEQLYRRALDTCTRVLGPEHPRTIGCINNLTTVLSRKGDDAGAEPALRRALEASERTLGPDHPDTLFSVNNLAILLVRKGDLAGAESLARRALEGRERALGAEHPDTLFSLVNVAEVLLRKDDLSGAEALFRRALEVRERTLGGEHPDTVFSLNKVADLHLRTGDWDAAEPLYRRALAAGDRVLGPEHPVTINSVKGLAVVLSAKDDPVGAEPFHRRALESLCLLSRQAGRPHPNLGGFVAKLAGCLEAQGLREDEVRQRIDAVLGGHGLGPWDFSTLPSRAQREMERRLVSLYTRLQRDPDHAEAILDGLTGEDPRLVTAVRDAWHRRPR